jgi:hypothetical protein
VICRGLRVKRSQSIQTVNADHNVKENTSSLTDNCGLKAAPAGHTCVNSRKYGKKRKMVQHI